MTSKPGTINFFSPLRYEKRHESVKTNENECLLKLSVTNDIFRLLLLSQPKSELSFTFPLFKSECGLFW